VQKDKPMIIPDDILKNYLSEAEIAVYNANPTIIRSITVYGEKGEQSCGCEPGCC
jgi:hypothetical protein